MGRSPLVLFGVAAALSLAVACSDDDEDDGDDSGQGGESGSGGSSTGGRAGSSTGGRAGSSTGGSNTGGSNTGGSSTGGSNTGGAGSPTGGTGGSTAGSSTGGSAGDEGGMGGIGGTDGGMGGETGEGGEMIVPDVLDNPAFSTYWTGTASSEVPGWQESGDIEASYLEWDGGIGGAGDHKLVHWRTWTSALPEFTADTFQTVTPIPNGTYSFSISVKRKTALTTQYVYARGFNQDDLNEQKTIAVPTPANETDYNQVTVSDIVVTSNQITVGVYTHSWGNDWAHFDNASLTKNP